LWNADDSITNVQLLRGCPCGTSIRILDIATGSADIPRALMAGKALGLDLQVMAWTTIPRCLILHDARPTLLC